MAEAKPCTLDKSWKQICIHFKLLVCCEISSVKLSSIKRHVDTRQEKSFKDEADKAELRGQRPTTGSKAVCLQPCMPLKSKLTEGSRQDVQSIAKHGKPFTEGEYVKEAFLSSLEVILIDY